MRKTLITFLALLTLAFPPVGYTDPQPLTYDRISFSEKAGKDVDNDTLVAILYVQREGRRAQDLANKVNQVVNQALDTLKGIEQIKVQSQAYRTNATYEDGRISGWRVHQSIRLESRDSKLLGDTIGGLQEHLNVQSISYRVSEEAHRRHADALVEIALKRFQKRATNITRTMGRSSYRIVSLQIHDGQASIPAPREMMATTAMARVAAPRIEAGTQRIEVSVTGEIELKD